MSLAKRTAEYIGEVRAEMGKVSWPNRKEIQANTGVVIIMVGILSVFIFILDRIFLLVLGLLLGRPGA